jgi:agmatinase
MQDSEQNMKPDNFGGIEEKYTKFGKSRVVILPIPLEKTTSYGRGTENGPGAIIEASKYMELYDQELDCSPYTVGIHTDFSIEAANLPMLSLQESLSLIESKASSLFERNKFFVSLGGEHGITPPIVTGIGKVFKGNFTVVQFDAHADLREKYDGEKYSHACVMKRVLEERKIVQIGIRSISEEEVGLVKSKKLKIFWSDQKVDEKLLGSILKEIKTEDIYITFDLDCLDPSIMPAVGTPEPAGYSYNEATYLLRNIIKRKNLIGIDFNELMPSRIYNHPDFLAAKLIYKVIAYRFFDAKR